MEEGASLSGRTRQCHRAASPSCIRPRTRSVRTTLGSRHLQATRTQTSSSMSSSTTHCSRKHQYEELTATRSSQRTASGITHERSTRLPRSHKYLHQRRCISHRGHRASYHRCLLIRLEFSERCRRRVSSILTEVYRRSTTRFLLILRCSHDHTMLPSNHRSLRRRLCSHRSLLCCHGTRRANHLGTSRLRHRPCEASVARSIVWSSVDVDSR